MKSNRLEVLEHSVNINEFMTKIFELSPIFLASVNLIAEPQPESICLYSKKASFFYFANYNIKITVLNNDKRRAVIFFETIHRITLFSWSLIIIASLVIAYGLSSSGSFELSPLSTLGGPIIIHIQYKRTLCAINQLIDAAFATLQ